ncbi:hypothetical protein SAMN00768000_3589 [Sulfobacillus thermosulfidooxidans DSM 9293]|uniref:Uncharacterized protein n=1 Tax=Sulfobacillus thermosulfidooxidans (strain DSM 9293 / VKM B-1269 / AT-1) TaxID=929705 RepID=A0A1W1WP49_SULTA|nr:hypothetical protein SAMN00768000_3589 [Sulfobacillus thermosulfidooxidans DSM 9293]
MIPRNAAYGLRRVVPSYDQQIADWLGNKRNAIGVRINRVGAIAPPAFDDKTVSGGTVMGVLERDGATRIIEAACAKFAPMWERLSQASWNFASASFLVIYPICSVFCSGVLEHVAFKAVCNTGISR